MEEKIWTIYLSVWLAVFGAVLGSFLACAVSRWAAGERMFAGRSRCASCGHVLSFSDLFPVFSYLFLRGRCRYCGAKIPADCLVSELAGAASFLLLVWNVPRSRLPCWLIAAALLLAISLADWAKRIIPDGLLLALLANRAVWFFVWREDVSAVFEILKAAIVPIVLLALVLLGERLTRRELMGGGDVKLLLALACYLSWAQLLLALLAGCIFGLILSVCSGQKRGSAVPFGPFLAAGALAAVTLGGPLIQWYFSLF